MYFFPCSLTAGVNVILRAILVSFILYSTQIPRYEFGCAIVKLVNCGFKIFRIYNISTTGEDTTVTKTLDFIVWKVVRDF